MITEKSATPSAPSTLYPEATPWAWGRLPSNLMARSPPEGAYRQPKSWQDFYTLLDNRAERPLPALEQQHFVIATLIAAACLASRKTSKMNHHLDLHLLPDPEFSAAQLMSALFAAALRPGGAARAVHRHQSAARARRPAASRSTVRHAHSPTGPTPAPAWPGRRAGGNSMALPWLACATTSTPAPSPLHLPTPCTGWCAASRQQPGTPAPPTVQNAINPERGKKPANASPTAPPATLTCPMCNCAARAPASILLFIDQGDNSCSNPPRRF